MKKQVVIFFLISLMFSIVGCTGNNSNKTLTQKEKLDDFQYMYKILKDNYPYLEVNKRLNGVDWLSKKNEYISKIKATKEDDSFFTALQGILSELNNGHTAMLDKNFYSYAQSVFKKDPILYEAWLKQLNNPNSIKRYSTIPSTGSGLQKSSNNITPKNVKTNIFEKGKVGYLSIHYFNTFNIEGDMKIIKPYLQSIKDYKALIIDIRGNGGGDSRYWANNIVPMLINKPLEYTQYEAYRGGSFIEPFIKCRYGFGYEKLEPISSIDKERLKNLPPELKEDFKYYYKEQINLEPKNSIGFTGKIYLLVDSGVFSSSEAFATFAKSTGFATLVGERTAGDGIGSDPAVCTLPNSGYVFEFTKEMGLTSDGTCNFEYKTMPDIRVPAVVNWNLSEDEAVQAVLKLVD